MTLDKALSDLQYGDRFKYLNKLYMLIDFSISECSLTTKFPEMFCALDLQTYKVVCFSSNLEVTLLDT